MEEFISPGSHSADGEPAIEAYGETSSTSPLAGMGQISGKQGGVFVGDESDGGSLVIHCDGDGIPIRRERLAGLSGVD